MRTKFDIGDPRAFKCCFCCHVKTGTIILGLWHLVVHLLVIGFLIVSSIHPEVLRNGLEPGTSMEMDGIHVITPEKNEMNEFKESPAIIYETPNATAYRQWRKEDMCLAFVLTLCSLTLIIFLLYGTIKNRPGYLMPFFCLQVFDFCLSCLSVVGYFSYAPNIKLWIQQQGLGDCAVSRRLMEMDDQWLMLLFVLVFFLFLSLKAYLIGMVWACYKYLQLVNANRNVVREYRVDPDSEMLLPPKYEDAIKIPVDQLPPPYTNSAN